MQMPQQAVDVPEWAAVEKLLTQEEVAAIARVPHATVRYWRAVGAGPRGFKLGRRVVYREQDVRAWLEQQYVADQAVRGSA